MHDDDVSNENDKESIRQKEKLSHDCYSYVNGNDITGIYAKQMDNKVYDIHLV